MTDCAAPDSAPTSIAPSETSHRAWAQSAAATASGCASGRRPCPSVRSSAVVAVARTRSMTMRAGRSGVNRSRPVAAVGAAFPAAVAPAAQPRRASAGRSRGTVKAQRSRFPDGFGIRQASVPASFAVCQRIAHVPQPVPFDLQPPFVDVEDDAGRIDHGRRRRARRPPPRASPAAPAARARQRRSSGRSARRDRAPRPLYQARDGARAPRRALRFHPELRSAAIDGRAAGLTFIPCRRKAKSEPGRPRRPKTRRRRPNRRKPGVAPRRPPRSSTKRCGPKGWTSSTVRRRPWPGRGSPLASRWGSRWSPRGS